ncbi:MAG: hypothetical protein K0M56_08590 [Kaistella sp.]|nr:hypothetical protein [Kaistella sp.]
MNINKHIFFFLKYGLLANLPAFIPVVILHVIGYFSLQVFLVALSIILIIDLSLILYIHISYYYINKNTIVESNHILHNSKTFYLQDLVTVTVNKSVNVDSYDGNLRFKYLPFEDYYYLKLHFKDNKQLILTCLLDPKIDEKLKELCPETQFIRNGKVFSPFPYW